MEPQNLSLGKALRGHLAGIPTMGVFTLHTRQGVSQLLGPCSQSQASSLSSPRALGEGPSSRELLFSLHDGSPSSSHESPPVSQVCYPYPLKEFSKPSVAKCLKLSLYDMVFRPLNILATLLWTHSLVNVPLKMGPADMVHQMLSTSSKYSGTVTVLDLDSVLLFAQIHIALVGFLLCFLIATSCYCPVLSLCSVKTPNSISCKPLSSQAFFSLRGQLCFF